MRILLAEDDPSISLIAKMTLEALGGHTVTTAANGQEALDAATTGSFDLLILDEMMPRLNGLRVCALYKDAVAEPSPVIFLSAKSPTDEVVSEFKRQGIGFIAKPFDPSRLCSQIDEIMRSWKGGG
jgi:DNA-binding response OmpR family regulator